MAAQTDRLETLLALERELEDTLDEARTHGAQQVERAREEAQAWLAEQEAVVEAEKKRLDEESTTRVERASRDIEKHTAEVETRYRLALADSSTLVEYVLARVMGESP